MVEVTRRDFLKLAITAIIALGAGTVLGTTVVPRIVEEWRKKELEQQVSMCIERVEKCYEYISPVVNFTDGRRIKVTSIDDVVEAINIAIDITKPKIIQIGNYYIGFGYLYPVIFEEKYGYVAFAYAPPIILQKLYIYHIYNNLGDICRSLATTGKCPNNIVPIIGDYLAKCLAEHYPKYICDCEDLIHPVGSVGAYKDIHNILNNPCIPIPIYIIRPAKYESYAMRNIYDRELARREAKALFGTDNILELEGYTWVLHICSEQGKEYIKAIAEALRSGKLEKAMGALIGYVLNEESAPYSRCEPIRCYATKMLAAKYRGAIIPIRTAFGTCEGIPLGIYDILTKYKETIIEELYRVFS